MSRKNRSASYGILEHRHRFAAWAASRAASTPSLSFRVSVGKEILEALFMQEIAKSVDHLPLADEVDQAHRIWRDEVIRAAEDHNLNLTHGVAAKLINVYLKTIFVCGGYHSHRSVVALHPPIDSGLLSNFGFRKCGPWSKFSSDQYEAVIKELRAAYALSPFWSVEEYWPGFRVKRNVQNVP